MALVRVSPDGQYRFGGGQPFPFVEVDWFRDDASFSDAETLVDEAGEELCREMIVGKRYFDPAKAYLVLSSSRSFTINYGSEGLPVKDETASA